MAAKVTPTVSALATKIVGTVTEPREQARLLAEWVSKNVRYVAVSIGQGKLAPTAIVGKSTCGSGDTGSTTNAIAPATATAIVSSVVATGRSINVDERLIFQVPDSPQKYPASPILLSSFS